MLISSLRMSSYSTTALCLVSCGFIGSTSDLPSELTSEAKSRASVMAISTQSSKSELVLQEINSSGTTTPTLTDNVTNLASSVTADVSTKSLGGAGSAGGPIDLPAGGVTNPILFVAQVPTTSYFGGRMSTFGNHQATGNIPRGGDLYIRYPDGSLRNLTKEAGFGNDGLQTSNSIAVREPSVHWSGTKAVFSMVVGAPSQFQTTPFYWQIYEVSGLGKSETVSIKQISTQPKSFNNVSPIYGTDDRIIFTSDRPRNGDRTLYPQLDEYESTPTNTGIWSLAERLAHRSTLLVG
jgi:hypothetical protein